MTRVSAPRRRRSGQAAPLITLTTDIGTAYAAQMKAVLVRRCPSARLVDLTHEVTSHSVLEGAFLLRYAGAGFPPGTIHLAIVDPGVGTSRRALVVRCADGSLLVGPDNGLLLPLARALGSPEAFALRRGSVARTGSVSATFEGRDVFAPAAALLAGGHAPEELGEPTQPVPYALPLPETRPGHVGATVLHVDVFGNVITNLTPRLLARAFGPGRRRERVRIQGSPRPLRQVRTYGDLERGELGLLTSSFGLLELAARESQAADRLRLKVGDRLTFSRAGGRRGSR